jgi:hypothetical protein
LNELALNTVSLRILDSEYIKLEHVYNLSSNAAKKNRNLRKISAAVSRTGVSQGLREHCTSV